MSLIFLFRKTEGKSLNFLNYFNKGLYGITYTLNFLKNGEQIYLVRYCYYFLHLTKQGIYPQS